RDRLGPQFVPIDCACDHGMVPRHQRPPVEEVYAPWEGEGKSARVAGVSKRTRGLTLRRIGFPGGGPVQPSLLSLALLLFAQQLRPPAAYRVVATPVDPVPSPQADLPAGVA